MKVIPPYQISTEIIDLINRAKKYVVLVSPYVDFTKWEKIKYAIKKAQDRGVKVEFFTRDDDSNHKSYKSREQIQALGIEPKLIYYLHAKLYYNEEKGIVTSMNLLTSSTLNSIEFGAVYDTESELKELQHFVKEFLLTPEEVAETPSEYVSLAKSNLKRVNAPEEVAETPSEYELSLAKEKFIVVLENEIRKHYYSHDGMTAQLLHIKYGTEYRNDLAIPLKGKILIDAEYSLNLVLARRSRGIIVYLYRFVFSSERKYTDISIKDFFSKKYTDYEIFVHDENGRKSIGTPHKYENRGRKSIDLKSYKSFTSDDFDSLNVSEKKEIIDVTLNFIGMLYKFYFEKGEFAVALESQIGRHNTGYVRCKFEYGVIDIRARKEFFDLYLDKDKMYIKNNLRESDLKYIGIFIRDFTKKYPNLKTNTRPSSTYSNTSVCLSESKKSFSSNDFNLLNISEKKEIIDITLNFIKMLVDFKNLYKE